MSSLLRDVCISLNTPQILCSDNLSALYLTPILRFMLEKKNISNWILSLSEKKVAKGTLVIKYTPLLHNN